MNHLLGLIQSNYSRFLAYLGLMVLGVWLDGCVFKVGETLTLRSRVLSAQIHGPNYPDTHQDSVAVVLFNDESLNSLKTQWPAPYSVHADVLSRILDQRPSAVFVDLLFVDERDDFTLDVLTEVIDDYRTAGVPLLFASPPPEMKKTSLLPEIIDAIGPHLIDQTASVRLMTREEYSDGGEYASALAYPIPVEGERCATWPVAFTMARIQQGLPWRRSADCSVEDVAKAAAVALQRNANGERKHPSFETRWGSIEGAGVEKLQVCTKEALSSDHLLTGPLQDWFAAKDWLPVLYNSTAGRTILSWSGLSSFVQRCPYTPSANAVAVLNLKSGQRHDSEPCKEPVQECLHKRVVLYGADISAAADRVNTPTAGRVPGVYVHAMALDNILTYGFLDSGKLQRTVAIAKRKSWIDWFVVIFVCVLIALLNSFASDRIRVGTGSVRISLFLAAALVASVCISMILGFLLIVLDMISYRMTGFCFLPPSINWLGIQGLAAILMFVDALGLRERVRRSAPE